MPLNVTTPAYNSFSGYYNTHTIIQYYIENPVTGNPPYAAEAAASYSKTVNGVTYADWFLPSDAELNLMYCSLNWINAVSPLHGGSVMGQLLYWSSWEYFSTLAWYLDFSNGLQYYDFKFKSFAVRCVRAF